MISTLGQKQLDRIKRPVARANINLDEIRGIKIILPSLAIQNKIVSLMENAYKEQKQKESEAQQLLDSIDDYVLSELGIKLPELKDQMTFVVYSNEVEGRIDPYYYKSEFREFNKRLSKIKLVSFGEIIKSIINGFDYRKFSDEGVSYIRVSNIKPFEFDLTNVKKINPNFSINKKIKLKKGDLLLTRKGTFGVALSLEKDEEYIISSEIFKIELLEKINPKFIEIILNSPIGQKQFNKHKIGGIMGSLSQEAVKQIKIPLPPLELQNKISEEVKNRMQKAKQLQKEAKEDLEKAKQEVEKIILGS